MRIYDKYTCSMCGKTGIQSDDIIVIPVRSPPYWGGVLYRDKIVMDDVVETALFLCEHCAGKNFDIRHTKKGD